MKFAAALKTYLEAEPHGKTVTSAEYMGFYKSLTPEEKAAGKAELRASGIEIEE